MVQLSNELQQMQGFENDVNFINDLELLGKIFKAFRCYYMALTCQGNRQWAEALALYQRSETYIHQAEGKVEQTDFYLKFHSKIFISVLMLHQIIKFTRIDLAI